jgi:hypothetical protein
LVLGTQFGERRIGAGLGSEALLDFSGVFVDRLTATLRILRLLSTAHRKSGLEFPEPRLFVMMAA